MPTRYVVESYMPSPLPEHQRVSASTMRTVVTRPDPNQPQPRQQWLYRHLENAKEMVRARQRDGYFILVKKRTFSATEIADMGGTYD